MNDISDVIRNVLAQSDFELNEKALQQFAIYAKRLVQWNKRVNLTAIVQPEDIAKKHFLDSLLAAKSFEIPPQARLIDVGTGAGFPGVPLKILRPDLHLTLLDSLNKRLVFLRELCSEIEISAEILHTRAEDAAKLPGLREQFDVVVSRAVAPLNVLLEYCMPFLRIGGVFLALKGSHATDELADAQNAIKQLHVGVVDVKKFSLIDDNDRTIIVFVKKQKIPDIYPRSGSKISKKPL